MTEAPLAQQRQQLQQQLQPGQRTDSALAPLPVDRQWLRKLLRRHGRPDDEPPIVLAPMVDQSDLPFRLLCRDYGVNVCFTPMVHAKLFNTSQNYRRQFTLAHLPARDRPLIAQICGGDVDAVVACARQLEPYCDGIDLNCGCPQKIAKRGHYGAYLLEQPEVLLPVVRALVRAVRVPVSVKVRLLPQECRGKENQNDDGAADAAVDQTNTYKNADDDDADDAAAADQAESPEHGYNNDDDDDDERKNPGTTTDGVVPPAYQPSVQASLHLYRQLVDAGVHMLTVHGRTRYQKGPFTSRADWAALRQVVQDVGHRIPILANGSIASADDARACLQITGCDGIMSSEGLLEYPPLLQSLVAGPLPRHIPSSLHNQNNNQPPRRIIGRVALARQYLAYAQQYPPDQGGQASGIKCIRMHIHRFCHADFRDDTATGRQLRDQVVQAKSLDELHGILDQIQALHDRQGHDVQREELSWYRRYTELNQESGEYVNSMEERRHRDRFGKAATLTPEDVEAESQAMNMASFFGSCDDNDDW